MKVTTPGPRRYVQLVESFRNDADSSRNALSPHWGGLINWAANSGDRDDQPLVQNRIDSPPCPLENQGGAGTGYPGMGVLVQPPPTAGADWVNSTGRG